MFLMVESLTQIILKPENGNNGECVDGGGDAEPGGRVKNPETCF